jgi:hypothetical protein
MLSMHEILCHWIIIQYWISQKIWIRRDAKIEYSALSFPVKGLKSGSSRQCNKLRLYYHQLIVYLNKVHTESLITCILSQRHVNLLLLVKKITSLVSLCGCLLEHCAMKSSGFIPMFWSSVQPPSQKFLSQSGRWRAAQIEDCTAQQPSRSLSELLSLKTSKPTCYFVSKSSTIVIM